MRGKALKFVEREYRMASASPLGDLAPQAAAAPLGVLQTIDIKVPDLTGYATARAKAEILLQSAAEVEHALMVQYLYAAYSLRAPESEAEASRSAALEAWREAIMRVAKEEMGHLLTVQNLLIAVGLSPNTEREDFPFRTDLYPFPYQLEPLSRLSLSKYVMAESPPTPPAGTEQAFAEIRHLLGKSMVTVNHVGVLYAMIGVVFAPATGFDAMIAAQTNPDRRRFLETVRELAAREVPAGQENAWHLADADFTAPIGRQGNAGEWRSSGDPSASGPLVLAVTDRASALLGIASVAVQGEGPGNTADGDSHFVRFLEIFRGNGTQPPFPGPSDGWTATRPVPTNPRLPEDSVAIGELIESPLAQAWCRVGNGAYFILLGLIEYYLLSSAIDRGKYSRAAFVQMTRRLGAIRDEVMVLPPHTAGGKEAALPFNLSSPLVNLPADEAERRVVMQGRYDAVVEDLDRLAIELTATGQGTDAINGWRQAYLNERAQL